MSGAREHIREARDGPLDRAHLHGLTFGTPAVWGRRRSRGACLLLRDRSITFLSRRSERCFGKRGRSVGESCRSERGKCDLERLPRERHAFRACVSRRSLCTVGSISSSDPAWTVHPLVEGRCPRCGTERMTPVSSPFCTTCGLRLASGMWGGDPSARASDQAWRELSPEQQAAWRASPSKEQLAPGSTTGTKICPRCAEEVKLAAQVCRFCGHEFGGQAMRARAAPEPPSATSGVAIASFITSLVGLWIAAIPLGIHAQRTIDRSGGRLTGRGFATAGIVLGLIGIVGTIILIIVVIHAANHPGCAYTYTATGQCVPGT